MSLFDRTLSFAAPRLSVAEAIKRSLEATCQPVRLMDASIIFGIIGDEGYVYIILSSGPQATSLRLIVDRADTVRQAFRANSAHDALEMLLKTPARADSRVNAQAETALDRLQQQIACASAITSTSTHKVIEHKTWLSRWR